eukprot:scaffold336_cov250-Pinguiococcus_pyrenoidosus.AAC.3
MCTYSAGRFDVVAASHPKESHGHADGRVSLPLRRVAEHPAPRRRVDVLRVSEVAPSAHAPQEGRAHLQLHSLFAKSHGSPQRLPLLRFDDTK